MLLVVDEEDRSNLKEIALEAEEFIRRFLLHILPDNFYKIRYYGILSSRNKKTKLSRCKRLLGIKETDKTKTVVKKSWKELLYELTGIDVDKCPKCKNGKMILIERIIPGSNSMALPP
jgi:hypothetical protein